MSAENMESADALKKAFRMLVVGVGGGGCNAVSNMYGSWTEGPDVAAVNTDGQALSACLLPVRVQIGKNLTRGLGTGGDPAAGKLAAEDSADILRELLSQKDFVVIVAALGGGTGSGAAPVLARIARDEGVMTLCFVTMPFEYEGERRQRQAAEGLRELKLNADVVVSLPNQRLLDESAAQASFAETFKKMDLVLAVGIQSLWRILTRTGIINLDFSDLRHLVEHSGGGCTFGYGEGAGRDKSERAIAGLLKDPLLENGLAIENAGALLVSIIGGPDLTLVDIQKTMTRLKSMARPDVRLFMGASIEESWPGRMALTLLAAEIGHEEISAETETPVEEPGAETGKKAEKKSKGKQVQERLNFEAVDKGRLFRNVEPTIYAGEDLDIPTFIRRGIKLSADR